MIAKNDDGIKRDDNQLELLASTRKNILLPSILKTERAKGRCTKINKNRRTAHRDQRAQAQNASFSPLLTSTLANPLKINHFPPLATDTEARRTLGNAYLSMVSEGDRSPPVAAAAKKEPPSAKRGRVVVCEHGRTRKTTVRCCDLALESRTTSHVFSPPGPPFRPLACQNVGRVVTSHKPPSDPARKPRHRAKGPQDPTPPRMPHFH